MRKNIMMDTGTDGISEGFVAPKILNMPTKSGDRARLDGRPVKPADFYTCKLRDEYYRRLIVKPKLFHRKEDSRIKETGAAFIAGLEAGVR